MKTKVLKSILIFVILACTVSLKANTVDSTENLSLLKKVENWYSENMNYTTITLLMTAESSFIPFPSEIVIPPAAYIASNPESDLNIFLVVLFGTIGALIGAYINYFLALWLGRPIVYKFADSRLGRFFLLSKEKVVKAETYFNNHGKTSTFIGRLIPVIRQLISIPAGLAKMNFLAFSIYTFIGAMIWNIILAALGYLAHGQKDLIDKYNKELSIAIVVIVVLVILFFIIRKLIKRKK
ncbi:MAG: DedA family protein [Bacteroidales bacterium]|jgi:membrane protein DedA with SNARE-associated domain|nr:DedA family protein [Bacteroidales bacterium]NLP20497.1 DedA family protein [Bacteroidales bacterium]OQC45414.1 MAG: Inner membrane protein YqjA [Bacteroidetes bacterium ADurb.Bin028]